MQGTTNEIKTENRAMNLLKTALEELRHQIIPSDISGIAKKIKCSPRTVARYLNEGYCADFNAGKKILDIGRKIVMEREQSLCQ